MGEFDLDVILSADRAKILRQTSETLITDREVRRSWDNIPVGAQEEIRAYFRSTKTYTNPVISGETLTGTWRSASGLFEPGANGQNGGSRTGRYIETIRFGYITSILVTPGVVDWTEGRLLQGSDVNSGEGIRIIEFRNIAEGSIEAVSKELSSETYTDFTIEGAVIAGTWNNVRVETDRADDHSGIVRILLATEEQVYSATISDGTLKPTTVARYFNVPDARIPTVLALATSAGTRQNKDARVTSYNNGFATITLETTTIETEDSDEAIAVTGNSTQTTKRRWNRTIAESDAFILSESYGTKEAGKSKRYELRSNGDKTWDIEGSVRVVDMLTGVEVGNLTLIDASEVDRRDPNTEAEIRRYGWFNVNGDNIAAVRSALNNAPSGWAVLDIDERFNDGLSIYNVIWTLEVAGGSRWDTEFQEAGSESERRTTQFLNRPTASPPADPVEAGYVLVSRQINDIEKVHADYIYTFHKVGTAEHTVEVRETGSEAATIRLELLRRPVEPTAPATPDGYTLTDTSKRGPDQVLTDYIYIYKFTGTVEHTTRRAELAGEVEVRTIELLSRSAVPTAPAIAGYHLTGDQINNPGSVLSDYSYLFHKIGVTDIETSISNLGFDAETITETLFSRTARPTPDPTKAGYTLGDVAVRNAEGALKDILYNWRKDGIATGTLDLRFVGSTSPFFMRRDVYVDPKVPDVNLTARINFLADSSNWPAGQIVASVRPQYNGTGQTDVFVHVVILPNPFTNYREVVHKFDGAFTPTEFSIFTKVMKYALDYDKDKDSSTYGAVTLFGFKSEVDFVNTGGKVGRVVRKSGITETKSYHKTEPSIVTATGSFADYTWEQKERDEQIGFWVKRSVRVQTNEWDATLVQPGTWDGRF